MPLISPLMPVPQHGDMADPYKHSSPPPVLSCLIWSLYRLNRTSVITEIRPENLNRLVPPFKVTAIDTDRSATYEVPVSDPL